jgi:hypothetical protein
MPVTSPSDIQNYWYCWNTGPTMPHHLGRYVRSDHPCTVAEFKAAHVYGY